MTNMDSKLCCSDASYPVHSVLMAVHSKFLRKTLKSIPDQIGTVFIVPDFTVTEITTLVRVMNGWDNSGCVSESLLKTLGFFSTEATVSMFSTEATVVDQSLKDSDGYLDGLLVEALGTSEQPALTTTTSTTVPTPEMEMHMLSNQPEPSLNNNGSEADLPSENRFCKSNKHAKKSKEPDITRYSCQFCAKTFKARRYLRNHILLKHTEDEAFAAKAKDIAKQKSLNHRCKLCKQMFNSRNIIKHLATDHPEVDLRIQCGQCEKKFEKVRDLTRHEDDVHSVARKFNCSLCDLKFKRSEHLETHLKTHTKEGYYDCEKCGFTTPRKRELGKHLCKPKLCSCDICGNKSVSKDALRKHMKRCHK